MKAGLSSYTYTWSVGVPGNMPENPLSAFDLVSLTADLGLSVLQMADNMPLHLFSAEERQKLKEWALQKGVAIETGIKRLDNKTLETYLPLASFFDSPFLRIVIDDADYKPGIPEIKSIIRNALPELYRRNIRLAIENHDRLTCRQFMEIVEGTDPDRVGICLDTVNSLGAGEGLETVIGWLAPHAINFHVKEFNIRRADHKMGFVVEGAILGEGMLPLEDILSKLGKNCNTTILEQWTPFAENLSETIKKEKQWAEKSAKYLSEMLTSIKY